jgi:LmbE family N-acetylglucosaminyl deacetylase
MQIKDITGGNLVLHIIRVFAMAIMIFSLCVTVVAAETVIWYIPHPDDETIGMADAIHDSVLRGATNYVVFFTKGGASLVRYMLVGPDGNVYRLTEEQLEEGRKKEALAALQVLGVDPANVVFLDFADGNITVRSAMEIISYFTDLFPDAIHCTVSLHDLHDDHRTLARALFMVNFQRDNKLQVRYYRVYAYSDLDKVMDLEGVKAIPIKHLNVKQVALQEYFRWAPEEGRYALGSASIGRLFLNAMECEYEFQDDITYLKQSLFFPFPVDFQVFGSGLGITVDMCNGFLLNLGVDFLDPLVLSHYLLYEIPNELAYFNIRFGMGVYLTTGKLQGILHVEAVDNYFLEYTYSYGEEGRIKLGIKSRI